MKFGELKSKIETYLVESYKKNKLKDSLFVFEQLVLKNKNVSKIFFLYDELSQNKGLNESVANEFIHESITAYENLYNKVQPKSLKELKSWVGHVQCENKYEEIDNLEKSKIIENRLMLFDEQFRGWLLIGLFFLVLEMVLSRTLFKSFI